LLKVRKHYKKLLELLPESKCDYTAPCVVGAMLTPKQRANMHGTVGSLIRVGDIVVPDGQADDLDELQFAYDKADLLTFERLLGRLEKKYLEPVPA
jgi:hypothetical protein